MVEFRPLHHGQHLLLGEPLVIILHDRLELLTCEIAFALAIENPESLLQILLQGKEGETRIEKEYK